ncbi:CsbD family protein [Aeromicrobium terrae]|uniref:CsbD family protein n=1 Tax=Aeromicrobium terrae TaxID=2498846 RepID=A0A5C8NRZ1_9ACTN|nr:CsbD family protein [Aeromicrobium terrae]TXL63233.1 CsbD family protein [Aeromicrobium terrae]
MGLGDKIENTADKLTGEAKEKLGDATGDDEQKTEGKVDQTKADLKQAGENVKDAFKD